MIIRLQEVNKITTEGTFDDTKTVFMVMKKPALILRIEASWLMIQGRRKITLRVQIRQGRNWDKTRRNLEVFPVTHNSTFDRIYYC